MGKISNFVLLIAAFFVGLVLTSTGQAQQSTVWTPGAYKGLTTGVSTMRDVARKFGKPKFKTVPEGPNNPMLRQWHYELKTDVTCCDLLFKRGLLEEITLNLGNVEQAKAVQIFGGRFIKVRFSDDYIREEGGSSPLCEDPKGDRVLLIDTTLGLYLWIEPDGKVSAATFSSTRPGVGQCPRN